MDQFDVNFCLLHHHIDPTEKCTHTETCIQHNLWWKWTYHLVILEFSKCTKFNWFDIMLYTCNLAFFQGWIHFLHVRERVGGGWKITNKETYAIPSFNFLAPALNPHQIDCIFPILPFISWSCCWGKCVLHMYIEVEPGLIAVFTARSHQNGMRAALL